MSPWYVFDKLYNRYDQWFEKHKIAAYNELKIIKSFKLPKPNLEVGVGTGYFSSKLDIDYGLDPSYKVLKLAYERGVESINATGENIPFRDNSISSVLIVVTICFLDDPHQTYNEIYRILRHNGVLLTCFIPRESAWGRFYTIKKQEGHPFYKYANFYSREEVENLIYETGFKIGDVKGIIRYGPYERPRIEEPTRDADETSFICIESLKD